MTIPLVRALDPIFLAISSDSFPETPSVMKKIAWGSGSISKAISRGPCQLVPKESSDSLTIFCDFFRLVASLLKPIVQHFVVDSQQNDHIEPSFREEVSSVKVNYFTSIGDIFLQKVNHFVRVKD